MTFFFRKVFFIYLLTAVLGVNAQQTGIISDMIYGSDPLLINGRYYTFFPPLSTGGNQFFSGPQFETGCVTLRGVTYEDLLLNYDIYNQQLILKYKNKIGADNLIILSDAWLEKFSFKGVNFETISIQDTIRRIFQVLGTGTVRILYYWRKNLTLDNSFGAKNHIFSAARKEMNVLSGTHIFKYRNNKNFCSIFGGEKGIEVREYLRKHNINVRRAVDRTMTELIYYCNSLYSE
jgi:hypothetical protein